MNKTLNLVRTGFLVAFALITAGIVAYSMLVIWPNRDCEKKGQWWAPKFHRCAHVLYLPNVTHRAPGTKAPKPTSPSDPVMTGKAP